ncbi:MAG: serine dehydratase subunit alpha family protein [Clostridia bacterium]|nr:serine dehydratase subunit alpha family protein [Clostridia bacterium]
MDKSSNLYQTYVEILRRELVPAMGCTEPIAVAFCAAKARKILGCMPEKIHIQASGNIIKNVKSVIVPHTNGMRGLEAAAAVGTLYGNADAGLEVISLVTKEQESALADGIKSLEITVVPLESEHILDLVITASRGDRSVAVHIEDEHTNITEIIENGKRSCFENKDKANETAEPDHSLLTVSDIFDFANAVDLEDVKETLERQISYNMAISREGLNNNYGARIGQLLFMRDGNVRTRAKAYAAAGSDARMSGCDLPVIINSGSGNQGMTASLPVIAYAEYYRKSHEELLRALTLSNLVTLHLKSGIGRLSAYCGAVSAGAGAGAGIAYLLTGDLRTINHTIVNALAISSGIVCDGAKASCAAKIAMAVDAGIMGFDMHENGCQFYGGDGLVSKGVENTIRNISALGNEGMKETDKKIIEIMTNC